MKQFILLTPIIAVFLAGNLYSQCTGCTQQSPVSISGSTIFTGTITLDRNYTVEAGGWLEFDNAIVNILPRVQITVEKGGWLIINNSTLDIHPDCAGCTTSGIPVGYWLGINTTSFHISAIQILIEI